MQGGSGPAAASPSPCRYVVLYTDIRCLLTKVGSSHGTYVFPATTIERMIPQLIQTLCTGRYNHRKGLCVICWGLPEEDGLRRLLYNTWTEAVENGGRPGKMPFRDVAEIVEKVLPNMISRVFLPVCPPYWPGSSSKSNVNPTAGPSNTPTIRGYTTAGPSNTTTRNVNPTLWPSTSTTTPVNPPAGTSNSVTNRGNPTSDSSNSIRRRIYRLARRLTSTISPISSPARPSNTAFVPQPPINRTHIDPPSVYTPWNYPDISSTSPTTAALPAKPAPTHTSQRSAARNTSLAPITLPTNRTDVARTSSTAARSGMARGGTQNPYRSSSRKHSLRLPENPTPGPVRYNIAISARGVGQSQHPTLPTSHSSRTIAAPNLHLQSVPSQATVRLSQRFRHGSYPTDAITAAPPLIPPSVLDNVC